MSRIIIFTGKGGVGKSSIASAHALASAKEGKKTLLVSTDMAHNLGDIFDCTVGSKITPIINSLDALELDPNVLQKEFFPSIKNTVSNLASSYAVGLESFKKDFALPGLANLFCLLKIKEIYDSHQYDRIFIDCAPTGETLALLKLPELLAWYMEKFFPVGKTMVRVLSPISKVKYGVTLPSRQTMNTIEEMHQNLIELQTLLKNKDICTTRLVCVPEKMIVEESKRNFMYLNLYHYQVDSVFINRVLPEEENPFLQELKQKQEKYIQELEELFPEIPIIKIPWYPKEIKGKLAVETLAATLQQAENLFGIRARTENEEYFPYENGYLLKIQLPGAENDKLQISFDRLDLKIKVNNVNRCIPLPNVLRQYSLHNSNLENGILSIYFEKKEDSKGGNE